MTHKGLKFSIAGAVLLAAVAYLGFAGMGGVVRTLPVDEYVANVEQQKMRVQLCGIVGEQAIERGALSAKFILKGMKSEVAVSYKGVVPDMFKAGREVVVEGKRDANGVFAADVLTTKCESKNEDRPANHPKVGDTKVETGKVKQGAGEETGGP